MEFIDADDEICGLVVADRRAVLTVEDGRGVLIVNDGRGVLGAKDGRGVLATDDGKDVLVVVESGRATLGVVATLIVWVSGRGREAMTFGLA